MRSPWGPPTVVTAMSTPEQQPGRATLGSLRRLAPYVAPHRVPLVGSGLAALVATLAGLAIPLITRVIVDGPIAEGDLDLLPWLVLGVLAFGMVEAGLILLRRVLVARPANRVEAAMRADLFAHLQRLPVAFHDRWPSGQLLSRATTDLTTIRWFVAFSGIFLVVNGLTVVVGVGVLAWLSPWLGLVVADHRGAAHSADPAVGAELLDGRPPGPGPGRRPRDRRRGVGAGDPGAQVAGPRSPPDRPVSSPTRVGCAVPSCGRCG